MPEECDLRLDMFVEPELGRIVAVETCRLCRSVVTPLRLSAQGSKDLSWRRRAARRLHLDESRYRTQSWSNRTPSSGLN